MSTIRAEVLSVDQVTSHPNADLLDVLQIGGATVVSQKGRIAAGDLVVYFPPNLLLGKGVGDRLGVQKYLKSAVYPGDTESTQCRVGACRLRGTASFGFAVTLEEAFGSGFNDYYQQGEWTNTIAGTDVSVTFGAVKYEPPPKLGSCDTDEDHPLFHRYTDIENYWKFPTAIAEGTAVRITEKIHGINVRFGLIDGEFEAGSHNVRLKKPAEGKMNRYWIEFTQPIKDMLVSLTGDGILGSGIVFGEIFGPGVQDMDYGIAKGQRGFRVFDVSVNGRYLDWEELVRVCEHFVIQTVPLFYRGPFDPGRLDEFTKGTTCVGNPTGKFKGREGVVVTPLRESYSNQLGGRMIVKFVGADYLDRKGAQDNA